MGSGQVQVQAHTAPAEPPELSTELGQQPALRYPTTCAKEKIEWELIDLREFQAVHRSHGLLRWHRARREGGTRCKGKARVVPFRRHCLNLGLGHVIPSKGLVGIQSRIPIVLHRASSRGQLLKAH